MQTFNFVLFGIYLLLTVALGLWVARRKSANARDYFLAGEGLPWYATGGSIIAANISTEHFISMVGVAYGVGFVDLSGGPGQQLLPRHGARLPTQRT